MELFKLLGTIAVENGDANKAIDDTTDKAEQSESKIGKFFNGFGKSAAIAGKAIGVGLAAGATAMTGLAVKALNLGGELEQNLGGSEAVFKDFAGKMQDIGKTAFKDMGLSTSDFLATANKMGALFQGAGFGIEESADISSKAMQRAADVASIMGIDSASAMEAVAGAAKGNFTMMDNLGVAMNDTAIQNYALSKGINKTTAEMTQQEKIGLAMEMFMDKTSYAAGNYAKENETLAGSLGTAKAALSNFLSGSGSVDDLVDSFSGAANVITDKLTELLPRLVTGLTDLINKLIPKIPPLLQALLPGVIKGAVMLLQGLANILPMVITMLMDMLPSLIKGVEQILTTLLKALISILPTLLPAIVTGIIQLIISLMTMLNQIIQPLIDALPTIIIEVVNALMNNLPALIDGLIQLTIGIVRALPQIMLALIQALPTVLSSIINGLLQALPAFITGIVQILGEVGKAMWTYYSTLFNMIWDGIKAIFAPVGDFFSGIWNGIKSAFGSVTDWFKNIFSNAWNAVKNVFSAGGKIFDGIKDGISNVFKTVVNGIIGGINKVISIPFNAINSMLTKLKGINILGVSPFDWIKTFTVPQIPTLATGGVLKKGQTGFLEGDGAEAVVPLERNTGWINNLAKQIHTIQVESRVTTAHNISPENGMERLIQSNALQKDGIAYLNDKVDKIINVLREYFPTFAEKMDKNIVLDTGALVGATISKIDRQQGVIYKRKCRGQI